MGCGALRGILSPLSQMPQFTGFRGFARLKADVLQQIDANCFVAHGALFTTSRMGTPGYGCRPSK